MEYEMIGLRNFICLKYKKKIVDKSYPLDSNIEERYLDKIFDDSLIDIVHKKIQEKLADKIAEDYVNIITKEIE